MSKSQVFFGGGGKKKKKNCTHTLSFIFHTLWIKIWFGQYGVDIQIKKNKKKHVGEGRRIYMSKEIPQKKISRINFFKGNAGLQLKKMFPKMSVF